MVPFKICFSLKSSLTHTFGGTNLEQDYKEVYSPILKFLYANKSFKIAFAFNGIQLEFLQKKHPESLELLKKLVSQKQVEILGGGYYDPAFPLLFPTDRSGQIEMLTSKIRQLTGRRPRGINMNASVWDSSLVTTFQTCGMDFVILDESLVPEEKQCFIPLIMSEKGKTISILNHSESLKPEEDSIPKNFLNAISKKITKSNKYIPESYENLPRAVYIQLFHEDLKNLLTSNWLEKLTTEIQKEEIPVSFTLPSESLKQDETRIPVYIPAGIKSAIAQWGVQPYKAVKNQNLHPVTIYDFFQIYPQIKSLYDRMLFVSQLLNQNHSDKIRKASAREKIWEAQNINGFLCTSKGSFVNSEFRQLAYKKITEAEKILRESKFTESMQAHDYNGDGLNEYIFRMQKYSAVLERTGGAIRELDILQNSGNYADNLERVKEFDGMSDNYRRGLFIDHIFTEDGFDSYIKNRHFENGLFANKIYSEKKLSQSNEVMLETEVLFNENQKIKLKKKYTAFSSGLMIQYILKNESSQILKAKFAVESSFAQTNFNAQSFDAFNLDIVSGGKKREVDTKTSSYQLTKSGTLEDVEGIWITDKENKITFVFEPNESCTLSFVPLIFKRPEYLTGALVPAAMSFSGTMFWDIELAPQMEMEKTVNFSIFNRRKGMFDLQQ